MLRTLTDRNFFALLGTYLAVGFGLLQFIEFLVNRYGLDPSLIDRYLIVWLVSLPAVAIVIYYRGRPPARPRWPHWVVPANLLLSLLLAFLLVDGDSEAAEGQETTVTVQDESGTELTAAVPGENQVKYLSVFAFDNELGTDSLEWWRVAIGDLLAKDLRQHPDYYPEAASRLAGYYNGQGLEAFDHLTVATQRGIAREARTAYFVNGSFARRGAEFSIQGAVMRTRDGKTLIEFSATDADPLAAIDAVSEQIVSGLPQSQAMLAGASDLPVASLVSENQEALRYLTEADIAFLRRPGDVEGALAIYRRAMAADPRCAECVANVADKLYGLGKQDSSIQLLQRAARLASDLPRRDQFAIRGTLYAASGEYDKYYQLMELTRKLYPYDYQAYRALLSQYQTSYGLDSAKYLMREAIRYGHTERGLLNLYSLHLQDKEYAEAEQVLDRYFEEFPERTDDRLKYVTLYELQNMPERAAQTLQELITLDPFNMSYRFALADMEIRGGKLATSPETYRSLLADSDSREDSVRAYTTLAGVYTSLGKISTSNAVLDELEELLGELLPPNRVLAQTYRLREYNYLFTGRQGSLDSLTTALGRYGADQDQIYRCVARLDRIQLLPHGTVEDAALEACSEALRKAQYTEAALSVVLAYADGKYAEAAERLRSGQGEERAEEALARTFQARVYRLAGDTERAEELLSEQLDIYRDEPNTLLELYLTTGNSATLAAALEVWADADEAYLPARTARALAAAGN